MRNIKSFIVLLGLVCLVVRAADYGIVANYSEEGRCVRKISVNSDLTQFVAISSDGKNTTINQFTCVDSCPNPIKPTETYELPYQDGWVNYVQYGTTAESKHRFYTQGVKGSLFEQGSQKSIFFAEKVLCTENATCLLDTTMLNEQSKVFVSNKEEESQSFSLVLTDLKKDFSVAYTLSVAGRSERPESILVDNSLKKLLVGYWGATQLGFFDIQTQKCESVAKIYPLRRGTSYQLLSDLKTHSYIVHIATGSSDTGIYRYDPRSNVLQRIIECEPYGCIYLSCDNTLIVNERESLNNGQLVWYDLENNKKIGQLLFGENLFVTDMKKINETAFLASASNGFIYQLSKKN